MFAHSRIPQTLQAIHFSISSVSSLYCAPQISQYSSLSHYLNYYHHCVLHCHFPFVLTACGFSASALIASLFLFSATASNCFIQISTSSIQVTKAKSVMFTKIVIFFLNCYRRWWTKCLVLATKDFFRLQIMSCTSSFTVNKICITSWSFGTGSNSLLTELHTICIVVTCNSPTMQFHRFKHW